MSQKAQITLDQSRSRREEAKQQQESALARAREAITFGALDLALDDLHQALHEWRCWNKVVGALEARG